ncbi:mechanosensitive ion channel domain-containing protein [Endozoicomonadaceae bacterium StTr2]
MNQPKTRLLMTLQALAAGLLVLFSSVGYSQRPPTIEALTQALSQQEKEADPAAKQNTDQYRKALAFLQEAEDEQEWLTKLQQEQQDWPQQVEKLRRELQQLSIAEDKVLQNKHRSRDLQQLEKLQSEFQQSQQEWQGRLDNVSDRILIERGRPETIRADVAAGHEREKKLAAQLAQLGPETTSDTAKEQQRSVILAEISLLQARTNRLNLELQGHGLLLEKLTLEQQLSEKQLARYDAELAVIQELLGEKRRADREAIAASATDTTDVLQQSRLLQEEAEINVELSKQLLNLTDQLAELTRRNRDVKQQMHRLQAVDHEVEHQLMTLGNSQLVARLLREQKQAIPELVVDASLNKQVADLKLQQYLFSQQRHELERTEYWTKQRLLNSDEKLGRKGKAALEKLIQNRMTLLDKLNSELDNLVTVAVSLVANQKSLAERSTRLSGKLHERLFLVASNPHIDLQWLWQLPQRLLQQFDAMPWSNWLVTVVQRLQQQLWLLLLLLGAVGLLVSRRPRLQVLQSELNERAGKVGRDSLLTTFKALVADLLLVLPMPLVLTGTGLMLNLSQGQSGARALGQTLLITALVWLVFALAIRLMRPAGVGINHFRWSSDRCRQSRVHLRKLMTVMLVGSLLLGFSSKYHINLGQDALGELVLLITSVLECLLIYKLLNVGGHLLSSRMAHWILGGSLLLLPVIQIALTLQGYYFTALQLQSQLVTSLIAASALVLLHGLVSRGLRLATRRLMQSRAQNRQKEGESIEADTDSLADVVTVNHQARSLANGLLLVALVLALYLVWHDQLPLLQYLQTVSVVEVSSEGSPVSIVLLNVLLAIVILVSSLSLSRNLPGLLEMLLLSRLELQPGAAYAIGKVTSYSTVGLGIVFALSVLGVSWDKLQWLVAAIGVGIGIGLQEIFANFISGLIILFERPLRIGDTITIGELTGEVTRIRIRATTIKDWDKKEIIVPNKTLVTDQLVNWSLSNNVVRMLLWYGVEHGSDAELVRRLLFQAARESDYVLKDPPPEVYFIQYSESAQVWELRIFVNHVDDRFPGINAANNRVHQLFEEHGIKVAHTQQDVHLHHVLSARDAVPRPGNTPEI